MENYYKLLLRNLQRFVSRLLTPRFSVVTAEKPFNHFSLLALISVSALWWPGSPESDRIVADAEHANAAVVSGDARHQVMDCHECYETINLSLDPNCERLITADLLLRNPPMDPGDFTVRLTVGNGLIIPDNTLRIQHVGQKITAMVSYVGPGPCPQGLACMTTLSLKSFQGVELIGSPPLTVYCFDPFLKLDPASAAYDDYRPEVTPGCGGTADGPYFGGDWVTIHDCVLGEQDTAKTIYRQWWAISKDGIRSMITDTIYVLRLPPITADNFYCVEKDTIYCGEPNAQVGPYILVPDPMIQNECDTIYLMDGQLQAASIDPKCGLTVRVDSLVFENTGCVSLRKFTVQLHQHCYGTLGETDCMVPEGSSHGVISGGNGLPIYAICEFWLTELDTVPPHIACNIDDHTMEDSVVCDEGLTLTQGYWKTHSIFGPAPYDDTWALLPNGENTPFFLSGKTYYQVLHTSPGGNAYYILAHQYIAARLNFLNGANPMVVQDVFDQATTLFLNYTPEDIDDLKGNDPLRQQFVSLSNTLCDYNEGLIGAGSCIEDGSIPTLWVSVGADCEADILLPDVLAVDICNEVILVKAMVETYGPVTFHYDSVSGLWTPDGLVHLELRPTPYQVIVEAFDACYNVARDTFAILVVDKVSPTAVAHAGLNFELPGKTGWLEASQIDNHSFDNCELNLILARRADWFEAWPDFCDSSRLEITAGPEPDTIWCKYVEPEMAINEFESYYAATIGNFATMMNPCGLLLYQSWYYDLCRYATVDCQSAMSESEFRAIYAELYPETDLDLVAQIGGGWAERVPFSCADACDSVKVELLVMDYWCNWSVTWTNVLVEDKSAATVAAEVTPEISLSCTGYYSDSLYMLEGFVQLLPLSTVFEEAADGNEQAKMVLDSVLGGYQKAWLVGQDYVDAEGQVIDPQFEFTDGGICMCNEVVVPIRYYDLEAMEYVTVDSNILQCGTTEEILLLNQGIIAVNCSENAHCEQSISFDLDACDGGTITRTFRIWKTCGNGNEIPDTVVRTQVITLENHCEINKYMFDLPGDTIIESCTPVVDLSGNAIGDAHPDSIGKPEYLFSDYCRIIGLAHVDKILTLTDAGNQCYAIVRTWYFADWCSQTEEPEWWLNESIVADSFTQIIVLIDSTPPQCEIEIENEVNDTVSIICGNTLNIRFLTFDTCGTRMWNYSLDTMSDPPLVKYSGMTTFAGRVRDTMELFLLNVTNGRYRFTVFVEDHCDNESFCVDTFVLTCSVSQQIGMQADEELFIDKVDPSRDRVLGDADDGALVPADLSLHPAGVDAFELFQNRPNPFRSGTVIGFYLPQSANARLTIYDIQGRRLKVMEGYYGRGYHEIPIEAGDLNATGVLYYQLDTDNYTQTRRMILTP